MSKSPLAAIDTHNVDVHRGTDYPTPFKVQFEARERRVLGDLFDLTQFGVNLVTLPPGAWSAQRHWHTHEDEFVYVVSGTPTLINDDGKTVLEAGMCAGFKAGVENGHHLVNESNASATYLEIGTRDGEDDGFYPDIDLQILKRGKGGGFTRRNGEPYAD
jgi:uncharacterized cupin superfamily protein